MICARAHSPAHQCTHAIPTEMCMRWESQELNLCFLIPNPNPALADINSKLPLISMGAEPGPHTVNLYIMRSVNDLGSHPFIFITSEMCGSLPVSPPHGPRLTSIPQHGMTKGGLPWAGEVGWCAGCWDSSHFPVAIPYHGSPSQLHCHILFSPLRNGAVQPSVAGL